MALNPRGSTAGKRASGRLTLAPARSSRKSFFYSISVLLVLVPIASLLIYYALLSARSASGETSKVVSGEARSFFVSMHADFQRALETSAKSAVLSSINEVVSTGRPFSDSRSALRNLVVTGSPDGAGEPSPVMGGNFLNAWASNMRNLSFYYGLNSTISIPVSNVTVSHASPFELEFTAQATVVTRPLFNPDSFNLTRTYSASAVVPVEGFEDPLYGLNSYGLVARVISANETPISNSTALDDFIGLKQYVPNADAPDFFNRLEGSLSASQFGFETIVDLNELTAQGLPVRNQSAVDHLYFNSTLPDQGHAVTSSSYAWLRLDCPHAELYGVSGGTQGC